MEGVTRDALISSSLAISAGGSLSDRLNSPAPSDTKSNEQINNGADNYMYGCRFFIICRPPLKQSRTSAVDAKNISSRRA